MQTVIDHTESQVPAAPLVRTTEPPLSAGQPTIMQAIAFGLEKGTPVEVMEKLYNLYERDADRKAAQEFAAAMAAFQSECPPIPKTSTAKIITNSGANYSYNYAELDEIARKVRPLLAKHGLSYTWDSEVTDGGVVCTCIVRHENGHSVGAKFACPTDAAAKMSGAQKQASALTYARRQSLVQALGLTTCDPDIDGASPDQRATITAQQAADIGVLIDEVKADKGRLLKCFGVDRIEDLPQACFRPALNMLQSKRGQS